MIYSIEILLVKYHLYSEKDGEHLNQGNIFCGIYLGADYYS